MVWNVAFIACSTLGQPIRVKRSYLRTAEDFRPPLKLVGVQSSVERVVIFQ